VVASPTPVKAAPVKKNEDEFDPFADGNEDDAAAAEALKAKAVEAKDKKVKAAPIAKSIIVWEVKPWGEETDLDALAAKILGITMDGLSWKTEYKKEPIAYGVFKIIIGAVVEDAKVSTDLVEETMMAFEDEVQSVDIQSFNKL
jgi:elongation factor 1-beta